MRKGLLFLAGILVLLLPLCLAAEDGRRGDGPRPDMRPPRPNPENMFQRLDANKDGVITPDELPEGMPEGLKQLLIRADENKDRTLTKEEFIKAFKVHRAGPQRPEAGPKQPHPAAKKAHPKPQAKPVQPKDAMKKKLPPFPFPAGFGVGPGARFAQPAMFNLKAIFDRLDRDKNGQLSFQEFAAGFQQMRQMFVVRAGQWAPKMQIHKGMAAWTPKVPSFKTDFVKYACPKKGSCPWTRPGQFGQKPEQKTVKMTKKPGMGPFCPMCCPWCSYAKHGGKSWFDYRGPQQFSRPQWMMFATHHWQPQMMPWRGWPQVGQMGFGYHHRGPEAGKERFQAPRWPWWGEQPKQLGKKPQFMKQPKPEPKQPEKKPEVKDEAGKIREIEARLTALEKQQAMLLAAVREVRMLLTEARQDQQPKEVAKVPPKPKHRQKPQVEERD